MKRGESSERRRKSGGKAKATMAEEDSKEQSKLLWASVCMCTMIKSINIRDTACDTTSHGQSITEQHHRAAYYRKL